MTMLRDVGPTADFPYLAGLGLNPEDLGRLDVLDGPVVEPGIYVEAHSGESGFFEAQQTAPEGVWVAQLEIDQLKPDGGEFDRQTGFGEGWGKDGPQIGGDRGYAEEDSGGTRRVMHRAPDTASQDDELPPG
jgi:hypothetical protein